MIYDQTMLEETTRVVEQLFEQTCARERASAEQLALVHEDNRVGARNFAHYLAVRQQDIRPLQDQLGRLGLSSLGRMESCTQSTLAAVLRALDALSGNPERPEYTDIPTTFDSGSDTLAAHTEALFGPTRAGRLTRIMVTLSPDTTEARLEELVRAGMDIVRLNCSKGNQAEWAELLRRLRSAEVRVGTRCKVLCDLAGPNPRTSEELKPSRVSVTAESGPAQFWLSRDVKKTRRAIGGKEDETTIVIGCTLPDIVDDLRPGQRVFYDDGKLSGVVTLVTSDAALVRVEFARRGAVKLKPGKGLNFPDTELSVPSLTDKDLQDLDFIVEHADMVGLSFVRKPEDVSRLRDELGKRGADHLGILLKIETTQAFQRFPELLLTALRSRNVGVMLARGDMAVELGFVRMAEVQEELLWLSEAALVPAVWATQVLDTLNKTGIATRAEVTDAAMSSRAECVMLNQGDNLVDTVRFVADVLERMQGHQDKKTALMRPLSVAAPE